MRAYTLANTLKTLGVLLGVYGLLYITNFFSFNIVMVATLVIVGGYVVFSYEHKKNTESRIHRGRW